MPPSDAHREQLPKGTNLFRQGRRCVSMKQITSQNFSRVVTSA